jgi:ACS family hexuronate transporter-like MFS transporter
LVLICLTHIIGAAAQYGINTFAPFYQERLGLSRAQVGLFFTAFYIGMAGFSFTAGWLTDRLGVRKTTLVGHTFAGTATVFAALAPSFSWAFASFLIAGLGYSFLNPASTKGVLLWFRHHRATAMGIKQTGVPAGGVVTALIGAPLAVAFGWRVALMGFGAANILFGISFWFLWRDPPHTQTDREQERAPMTSNRVIRLKMIKSLLALSCGTALLLVGQMSLLTYLPLFLKEELGFPAVVASQWLAVTQVGAMLGRVGWGVISDRLFCGRRKIVLVLIGVVSVSICLALSQLSRGISSVFLVPLGFFGGLTMIGYQGVSYSLIGEISGQARAGMALGLMITINALGTVVGTPLIGYIVDATGAYSYAWLALAATVLLGTINLALFVKEPEKRPRDNMTTRP